MLAHDCNQPGASLQSFCNAHLNKHMPLCARLTSGSDSAEMAKMAQATSNILVMSEHPALSNEDTDPARRQAQHDGHNGTD